MDYISQANVGGTTYNMGLPNVYINDKGNFNIETSAEIGNTTRGKINIESMDDIQLKPGDDIVLYSHHRAEDKQDEVAVKVTDGEDVPVKLQLNASEILLTTKDKVGDNSNVMDVTVNSGKNERGYLKVRAQAIDLRSESHGGIALQPKGKDSQNHENKIKFEHGGGDGLEFGTFNTEKTSIFTDEYRFNKDGVWKMATRTKEASDKADADDPTTAYKYVKADDDFYDNIDNEDVTATTKNIIETAYALNGNPNTVTHITSKGNLEIASVNKWTLSLFTPTDSSAPDYPNSVIVSWYDWNDLDVLEYNTEKGYTLDELATILQVADSDNKPILKALLIQNGKAESGRIYVSSESSGDATGYYEFTKISDKTPNINIESDTDISIKAAGTLKLGGILDWGSTFGFGETDEGIEVQYKLTKKNATKDCGILKVVGYNNSTTLDLTVEGVTIDHKQNDSDSPNTETIAQCSILDIIKLVNYMKTENQGPWTQPAVNP